MRQSRSLDHRTGSLFPLYQRGSQEVKHNRCKAVRRPMVSSSSCSRTRVPATPSHTCSKRKSAALEADEPEPVEPEPEPGLAIYITAHRKHSGMRINGLSTDAAFNCELGQDSLDQPSVVFFCGHFLRILVQIFLRYWPSPPFLASSLSS
jgi:hypothetical protein